MSIRGLLPLLALIASCSLILSDEVDDSVFSDASPVVFDASVVDAWKPWRLEVAGIPTPSGGIDALIDTDQISTFIFDVADSTTRYALVARENIVIDSGFAIIGDRPLVILAETIVIDGSITIGTARRPCIVQASSVSGGHGASGQQPGASGGAAATSAPPAEPFNRLRVGCSGQSAAVALGGEGGGAVQFVALSSLEIRDGAMIIGGGGGGGGGSGNTGGGGGGAGGMVVLDSPRVMIGSATLVSSGGGGGGGASGAETGSGGSPGGVGAAAGGGSGSGSGGSGGSGGYAGIAAKIGGEPETGGAGGGGGGGGVGFLLLNTAGQPILSGNPRIEPPLLTAP